MRRLLAAVSLIRFSVTPRCNRSHVVQQLKHYEQNFKKILNCDENTCLSCSQRAGIFTLDLSCVHKAVHKFLINLFVRSKKTSRVGGSRSILFTIHRDLAKLQYRTRRDCPPSGKSLKAARSNSRDRVRVSATGTIRMYSNRSSITRLMLASHETSILIKGDAGSEGWCILSISPVVFTVKHECNTEGGSKKLTARYTTRIRWVEVAGRSFHFFAPFPLSLRPFPIRPSSDLALKWGYMMGVARYCHIIPVAT